MSGYQYPTGLFITFEGVEGCGKTTQIRLLGQWLAGRDAPFRLTREPGGTKFGALVRAILLDRNGPARHPLPETLLYLADRYQDLHEIILPALDRGETVICDRYHDATLAYQGFARQTSPATIQALARELHFPEPHRTFLLDLNPEIALRRAWQRDEQAGASHAEGRFEAESLAFHHRVRHGYLELAAAAMHRFTVLDAGRPPETIHEDVIRQIRDDWQRFTGHTL